MKHQIRKPVLSIAAVALVTALSAGCASTADTGDKMKSHATSVQDISKQWKQGNELVSAGEQTKSKGSDLVNEGQKQIAEGESKINRGRTLMAESEVAFREASRQAQAK